MIQEGQKTPDGMQLYLGICMLLGEAELPSQSRASAVSEVERPALRALRA